MIALSIATVACSGGDDTPSGAVDQAGAYTAIVEWQAGEQEPVENEDGTVELPVVYVAAADGETIDVGVQAKVAEETVDVADVRFADDSSEAFDEGVDGAPVIDDGSLLLVGAMPEPAPTIEVEVLRYLAAETSTPFTLLISADDAPDSTAVGSATVTSATPN
jgi:hypothetical protein